MSEGPAIYIGVGANIDPEQNILIGLQLLSSRVSIIALSTFYRSEAIDAPGTPDFINGVCRIKTKLPPEVLKSDVLRVIETDLGRVRGDDPNAPRPLDLDLLLYGDCVDTGLGLPDSDILSRAFLFESLLELDPDFRWPGTGRRIMELAADVPALAMRSDMDFTRMLREKVGI